MSKKIFKYLLPATLGLAGSHLEISAQTYSMNWYKIASGGGISTNDQYSLNGTVGQPDVGAPMNGGNYSLTGGFWSFIAVAQSSGAPPLYISHSGSTLTIDWQDVAGWTLQQTSNLSNTAGWSSSRGVITSNGYDYLNVVGPTGSMFFRLKATNP